MIHQVREGLSRNGDPEILHMREIGLRPFARGMALFKDHLLLRSMQRSPAGDMAAQRAVLRWAVATRMLLAQQSEERGGLQGRIAFELRDHPGPVFLEGVRARLPIMGTLELGR